MFWVVRDNILLGLELVIFQVSDRKEEGSRYCTTFSSTATYIFIEIDSFIFEAHLFGVDTLTSVHVDSLNLLHHRVLTQGDITQQ